MRFSHTNTVTMYQGGWKHPGWPGQFCNKDHTPSSLSKEKAGNKACLVRCGQTPLLVILLHISWSIDPTCARDTCGGW